MLPYAIAIFLVDRISKWAIVEWLDLKSVGYIEVVDPYLNLAMAWNRGVNFGLLNLGVDGRWILIALAIVIVAVVLWWTRSMRGPLLALSTGAVVGGAAGNVWDRLQYGAVADFLNMSCCGIQNPFAFNVADIAIFGGAIGLILFGDRSDNSGSAR